MIIITYPQIINYSFQKCSRNIFEFSEYLFFFYTFFDISKVNNFFDFCRQNTIFIISHQNTCSHFKKSNPHKSGFFVWIMWITRSIQQIYPHFLWILVWISWITRHFLLRHFFLKFADFVDIYRSIHNIATK